MSAKGSTSSAGGKMTVAKMEPGANKEERSAGAGSGAPGGAPSEGADKVTVDDLDADLLPILHDIVRTIEKDNQDVSQKNKDSLEASQKIAEVHAKICALRENIYKLPGIEKNREEQLRQLEVLRQQLHMKKRIIQKYKELNLKVSGLSGQNSF